MKDTRSANIAALAAVLVIAQQIASKATRDTLFLTSFDANQLPQVMLAAAGLSLIGVLALGRLQGIIGPARLIPGLFMVSAGLYAIEAALQAVHPEWVAYAIYLHIALVGAVVISGFWSVVNERFDPHAAKRFIGRIAMGATVGGVLGGLAAKSVAATFGAGRLLVLLAVLNVICGGLIAVVARGQQGVVAQSRSGLEVLRNSAFLRRIAGAVSLLALGGALLDFALKATADGEFDDPETLASFFALYYTAVSIATFLVQTLVTKKALERFGIGAVISIMPLAIMALGSFGAAFTRLWSVIALRGTATALENSVHRSGYELLYTPVPPAKKRQTKLVIDVAGNRLGDAMGSGIVLLLLLALATDATIRVVIALAVISAAGALILIVRLQRGYVAQLAESLSSGALLLDADMTVDATTRRTLAETTMALDRDKLLEAIAAHRRDQVAVGDDLIPSTDDDGPVPSASDVAALIPQLAIKETRRMAGRALRKASSKHLGQIIDALLDPNVELKSRRRLPPIVASVASPRAVQGLMDALQDLRFEVRYRAGLALSALCARDASLAPKKSDVFAAATREVHVGRNVWESQRLLEDLGSRQSSEEDANGDDGDDGDDGFGKILRERRDRSLEHVFNILSLTLDRDTLRLSLQALLYTDNAELRGTALEYLENVLPDDVRRGLWPYLVKDRKVTRSGRAPKEIVDDLLSSMDSLQLERSKILEKIKAAGEANEPDV